MRFAGWLYPVLVAISGVSVLLVIAYAVLVQDNRRIQAEVNRRQQFINQSIELRRINEALIRAIAAAAINKKDEKLRQLLVQNGITINPPGDESTKPPGTTNTPAGKTQ
jgi:type II secretory pathway component PulJ